MLIAAVSSKWTLWTNFLLLRAPDWCAGRWPGIVSLVLWVRVVAGLSGGLLAWLYACRRPYRLVGERGRVHRGPWWLLGAAGGAGAVWPWQMVPTAWMWPFLLVVIVCWLVAVEVDLDVHRLPDALTVTTWAGYGVVLAVAGLVDPNVGGRLVPAMVCSLVLAGVSFVVGLATGQVGLGDVKLLGGVGLVLGSMSVASVVCAVAVMSVVGAVCAGVAVVRGAGRHARLPAGPGIVAGAVLGPVLAALL